MNTPFFSVVIPTHNRSLLLKRSVGSVLCQTFKDFEVIVIDDHSTDNTPTVVKSFSDRRFRYLKNNRSKGACGARNTGIFEAKGKWVAFQDDDDIWHPEKLEYQKNLICNSGSSVGLVCTDYSIYIGKGKKDKIIKNRPSGWVYNKILKGGLIGCLSSTCVKTNILSKVRGFDETFPSCQDQDLWLRIAEISEFQYVPKILVFMFQDNRVRIGTNSKSKLDGYVRLMDKYFDKINNNILIRIYYETRIFLYAVLELDKRYILKCLPWFLLGAVVNLKDFIKTIMTIFWFVIEKSADKNKSY